MNAKELMLGDFVTFKDCKNDKEPVIIRIVQLNENGDALVSIDGNNVLDEIEIDEEVVGIPLTPEILEKNGIIEERVEDIYAVFRHKDFTVTPDIDNNYKKCWMLYVGNIDHDANICIYYVHQLQHALRLCGIEKEIII